VGEVVLLALDDRREAVLELGGLADVVENLGGCAPVLDLRPGEVLEGAEAVLVEKALQVVARVLLGKGVGLRLGRFRLGVLVLQEVQQSAAPITTCAARATCTAVAGRLAARAAIPRV
jgi:hypothetical protein